MVDIKVLIEGHVEIIRAEDVMHQGKVFARLCCNNPDDYNETCRFLQRNPQPSVNPVYNNPFIEYICSLSYNKFLITTDVLHPWPHRTNSCRQAEQDYNDKKPEITGALKNHGMSPAIRDSLCLDLDGTIIDFYKCQEHCDYSKYPNTELKRDKCPVMDGAAKEIRSMKNLGLKIIIQTGRVSAEREVTEKWLKDHDIVYVDDFGYRFDTWPNVRTFVEDLRKKHLEKFKQDE